MNKERWVQDEDHPDIYHCTTPGCYHSVGCRTEPPAPTEECPHCQLFRPVCERYTARIAALEDELEAAKKEIGRSQFVAAAWAAEDAFGECKCDCAVKYDEESVKWANERLDLEARSESAEDRAEQAARAFAWADNVLKGMHWYFTDNPDVAAVRERMTRQASEDAKGGAV